MKVISKTFLGNFNSIGQVRMRIKRFLAFVLLLVTTGSHIGSAMTFKL